MHAALPDVVHARAAKNRNEKFLLQTVEVHVLKAEIVIVLVVAAKESRASLDVHPSGPVERHAHVVLAGDPRIDIKLVVRALENVFRIRPKRHDVARLATRQHLPSQQFQHRNEVLGHKIIFFEQQQESVVMFGGLELVKDPVELPPPVVLHLREPRLSEVAVHVGMKLIVALQFSRFNRRRIPRTIFRIIAGKRLRVGLNRVRVKNLQKHTEVDALHYLIDGVVINIMRHDEKSVGNVLSVAQAVDEMRQVGNAVVDLNRYQNRLVRHRAELFEIMNSLDFVVHRNQALNFVRVIKCASGFRFNRVKLKFVVSDAFVVD